MATYYKNVKEVLEKRSEERTKKECLKLERWFRSHSKLLAKLEQEGVVKFKSMLTIYEKVVRVLQKPCKDRTQHEMINIMDWFISKSKVLFREIPRETLLDVIQHCEFVTRNRDDVIIQQGEKGHRFYIILKGSVAVYLYKDGTPDNLDLGEESIESRQVDRSILGFTVATLSEGVTFGEIALINTDCIRTASIICEETTDLVSITRDLYNRSVSKVVAREYAEKVKFIDSISLFQSWSPKLKKQMAVSLRKETHNFDSVLVKQGDPAADMYFIVKGEVKMMLDVETHYTQYEKLFDRCADLMDEFKAGSKDGHFPAKMLPQLEKITRMNKASMLKNSMAGSEPLHVPVAWSPSAIRKMNLEMNHKRVNINLCFLGQKQIIGDVEFLLGLDTFHHTATCSRETTVMVLNKSHFDRLFRKRSPRTLTEMGKMVETQLTLRCLKPNILETAPVLRVLLYRLQELNGERKRGDGKNFLSTLRYMSNNFERDAGSRSSNNTPSRPAASLSSTPDRMSCDTPDLAHAHAHPHMHRTGSHSHVEDPKSRTIMIPKVEV